MMIRILPCHYRTEKLCIIRLLMTLSHFENPETFVIERNMGLISLM